MDSVWVNNVGDDGAVLEGGKEDKVRPHHLVLIVIEIGDPEGRLAGLLRIAVPEAEAGTALLVLEYLLLPHIQDSRVVAVLIAQQMIPEFRNRRLGVALPQGCRFQSRVRLNKVDVLGLPAHLS